MPYLSSHKRNQYLKIIEQPQNETTVSFYIQPK